MTPRRIGVLSTVLAIGVAGCFTTAADFGADAETFIVENEGLRSSLLVDADARFTSATCVAPENQDEGTTFPCTGTDSDGAVWEFEVVITGSNGYEVSLTRRPPGS